MSTGSALVRFAREVTRWKPEPDPFEQARETFITRMGDPTFQGWVDSFLTFQGQIYQPGYTTTYAGQKAEPVADTFLGYTVGAYRANGVIFATSMARARLFSEARFKFRRLGQTGGGNDLFGNQDLKILERPWPGGTTQSLLMRAEQDVTVGGTFFLAESEDGQRLLRRRPDWMQFILDVPPDEAVESNILGYRYTVGGPWTGGKSKLYLLDECVHWSPIPDPDAMYRGMSWLTPIIKELQADSMATEHKLKFFENAATPNLAVSLKETIGPDAFGEFVRKMREDTQGVENAYKTLYTGGGADVTVIGANMQQLAFAETTGHGETRIAAAGGVPPIIIGLSEGLAAATYSNYGQARRAFGDTWGSNQWRSFCGAISPIVTVPEDAELWYDTRDIPFLREDTKDLADVQGVQATTINTLITAGFTPQSAVAAVLAEDYSLLIHSGLVSVQLQAPGGTQDAGKAAADDAAAFSSKVTDVVALTGAAFDPDSVVAAAEAQDLSLLVMPEPEPEPAVDPTTGLPVPVDDGTDPALAAADETGQPG
jgi:hypothetical protein